MRYDRFAKRHSFDLLGFIQLLYDTTCLKVHLWVKLVWGLGCAPKVRYGTMARVVLDGTLSEDRDNSEGELRFYCSFKKCNECIFL